MFHCSIVLFLNERKDKNMKSFRLLLVVASLFILCGCWGEKPVSEEVVVEEVEEEVEEVEEAPIVPSASVEDKRVAPLEKDLQESENSDMDLQKNSGEE